MKGLEKRKDRRLAAKLDLLCRSLEPLTSKLQTGTVVNIAAGGLYFHTAATRFEPGNRVEVSIEVPPGVGRLEFGGTMRTVATVVRAEMLQPPPKSRKDVPICGVALQFCRPLKLR